MIPKTIHQKLLQVKRSVHYLKKENQGQQYNYVSSSQVITSIRDEMNNQGLLLIPNIIEAKQINYDKKNGTKVFFTELKISFTWVNADKSDEMIQCIWYGQGIDYEGEKGVGKALTYAEKYFLLKFFNIPTDKDDPDTFQDSIKQTKQKKQEQTKQNNPLIEKKKILDEFMQCVLKWKINVPEKYQKIAKNWKNQSESQMMDLLVWANVEGKKKQRGDSDA